MRIDPSSITAAIRTHRKDDGSRIGVASLYLKDARVETDKGKRDIVGWATTDQTDCVSDVVLPQGSDPSYFAANKNIFADHHYDMLSGVGILRDPRTLSLTPDGYLGWKIRATICKRPEELCDVIVDRAADGVLAFSIGFEPTDWGEPTADERKKYPLAECIIRKWKWRETSVTLMPCNVSCRGELASMDESKADAVAELVTKMHPEARRFLTRRMPERRKTLLIV